MLLPNFRSLNSLKVGEVEREGPKNFTHRALYKKFSQRRIKTHSCVPLEGTLRITLLMRGFGKYFI